MAKNFFQISPISEIAGTKWIHKKNMPASYNTFNAFFCKQKRNMQKLLLKRAGKSNKTIESRIDLLVKQDAIEWLIYTILFESIAEKQTSLSRLCYSTLYCDNKAQRKTGRNEILWMART